MQDAHQLSQHWYADWLHGPGWYPEWTDDLVKEDTVTMERCNEDHHLDEDQLVMEEQKQIEMQINGTQDKPEDEQQPKGEM